MAAILTAGIASGGTVLAAVVAGAAGYLGARRGARAGLEFGRAERMSRELVVQFSDFRRSPDLQLASPGEPLRLLRLVRFELHSLSSQACWAAAVVDLATLAHPRGQLLVQADAVLPRGRG